MDLIHSDQITGVGLLLALVAAGVSLYRTWKAEKRNDGRYDGSQWKDYVRELRADQQRAITKLERKIDEGSKRYAETLAREQECQRQLVRTGERFRHLEQRCNELESEVRRLRSALSEAEDNTDGQT